MNGQGTTPAPPETTPAPEQTTPGAFQPPTRHGSRSTSAPSDAAAPDRSWVWIALASALAALALAALLWLARVAKKRGDLARFRARVARPVMHRIRGHSFRGRRAIRPSAFVRQPAHAYAGVQRRLLPVSSGQQDPRGGWQFALGRLRRILGRKNQPAESAWAGSDWKEGDPKPRRPVELIESYSAVEPAPPDESPAEEPPPEERPEELGTTPVAGEAAVTAEGPEQEPEGRLEKPQDALTSMLIDQVAVARETHHALTLVAVRFVDAPDEAAPEPDELRERVQTAVRQALVSTEEPEVVVDSEERLVWVVLPGLLPKRALDVVSEARRLLHEDRTTPVTVAISAYPRDGATAEELVHHCHAELERAGAHAIVADWRSEVSG
ncbi:MAG TPA: hypothetical protein VGQ15_10495 [Gaiellaceae bacterium]|nr:hypothetical protein [Gaiellaceae bacterium]